MDNYPILKNTIEISDTIPGFVSDLYPKFVEFIDDYFEFLETNDNFLDTLENFQNLTDTDRTSDVFINKFLSEAGLLNSELIQNINIDKKILINYINQINSSRGSPQSFKLFYKLFFNSNCEISYPRDSLLSSSNYDYRQKTYLIVSTDNILKNVTEYQTTAFSGNYFTSKTEATSKSSSIDSLTYFIKNNTVYAKIEFVVSNYEFYHGEELLLNFNGIDYLETVKSFIDFEIIDGGFGYSSGDLVTLANVEGSAKIKNVTTGSYNQYQIINGGKNYLVGDAIKIVKINSNDIGYGFSALVSKVNSTGSILDILIFNEGFNYSTPVIKNENVIIVSGQGTGAILEIKSNNIGSVKDISLIDLIISEASNLNNEINEGQSTGLLLLLDSLLEQRGVYVNSTGSNLKINFKEKTTLTEETKFFSKNKLGNNLYILNSEDHLHGNSYTIESNVSSNYSNDIVESYLHPAGLYKHYNFLIDEIIQNIEITTDSSNNDLIINKFFEFDSVDLIINISNIEVSSNVNIDLPRDYNLILNCLDNLEFYKFSNNYTVKLEDQNFVIQSVQSHNYFNFAHDVEIINSTSGNFLVNPITGNFLVNPITGNFLVNTKLGNFLVDPITGEFLVDPITGEFLFY